LCGFVLADNHPADGLQLTTTTTIEAGAKRAQMVRWPSPIAQPVSGAARMEVATGITGPLVADPARLRILTHGEKTPSAFQLTQLLRCARPDSTLLVLSSSLLPLSTLRTTIGMCVSIVRLELRAYHCYLRVTECDTDTTSRVATTA
jgi:hypothetical protein